MSKRPVKTKKKTASAAKAPKTTKKPSRARTTKPSGPSAEERHRMIAHAAFQIAVKHGVADRNPMRDWLEAEAEVDAQLAPKAKKKSAGTAKKTAKKSTRSAKKATAKSKKKAPAKAKKKAPAKRK